MDRKDFLRNAAVTVSALFAVNWGSRAAIKSYKDFQKPLLTEKNLSKMLVRSKSDYKRSLDRSIVDTKAWLEENFTLSPQQQTTLRKMTNNDWKNIKSVLLKSKESNSQLQFKFINSDQGGCERVLAKALNNKGKVIKEIAVTPGL